MILRRPSGPILLLILLTITTLVGPIAIGVALRGGARSTWPPDRPIEWGALGLVTVVFVVLMVSTMAAGLKDMRRPPRSRAASGGTANQKKI